MTSISNMLTFPKFDISELQGAIFNPAVFRFTKPELDWSEIRMWLGYNGYSENTEKRLFALLDDMATHKVTIADGLSELCARFCYRAFKVGRPTREHIHHIIESGHGSVFAHVNLTFSIQGVSRTLTHELIRHHVGVNPSQESQRYVDAEDMEFVVPPLLIYGWNHEDNLDIALNRAEGWLSHQKHQVQLYQMEQGYLNNLLQNRNNPFGDRDTVKKRVNEAARCHLPGCAETRLTWTMNLRAARDILGNPSKRGSIGADLEIRRLAIHLLLKLMDVAPVIFQDFSVEQAPVIPTIKSEFGGV